MKTELNTNNHYIVRSIYKGKGYPDIFKMKVYEVTDTTYLISNLDATVSNKERFTKENFKASFSIIEEICNSSINNSYDIDTIIMNAKNYGKKASDDYGIYIAGQWSPYNNK